jgi:hypothetical protein
MAKLKVSTLNLRIEPGLKEAVREAAAREHRSVANMVEMLIRRHCDQIAGTVIKAASLFRNKMTYFRGLPMDERMLKAMVAAGAIKNINIIASGARFHIEAKTPNGPITAETRKGKIRTWVTLDAAARWVRGLGLGAAQVNLTHWQPGQRELSV